jgi:hypothetical protein
MERLEKLRALSPPERRFLAEALAGLALARLVVALLPFRLIGRWASRRPQATASAPARRVAIARVRWAVSGCARRVPFRARCFEQGLAAMWMLRRRGIRATLHFGAARQQEDLVAHVWITADDGPVIGCEIKDRFFEFVRFPDCADPAALT